MAASGASSDLLSTEEIITFSFISSRQGLIGGSLNLVVIAVCSMNLQLMSMHFLGQYSNSDLLLFSHLPTFPSKRGSAILQGTFVPQACWLLLRLEVLHHVRGSAPVTWVSGWGGCLYTQGNRTQLDGTQLQWPGAGAGFRVSS